MSSVINYSFGSNWYHIDSLNRTNLLNTLLYFRYVSFVTPRRMNQRHWFGRKYEMGIYFIYFLIHLFTYSFIYCFCFNPKSLSEMINYYSSPNVMTLKAQKGTLCPPTINHRVSGILTFSNCAQYKFCSLSKITKFHPKGIPL